FGSNIDVARCGWDVRICEQWQIQCAIEIAPPRYFASLNMARFHCHCERAARAWQSTGKESRPSKNPNAFKYV
ncbi:MAG: hypothetical protein K2N54_04800, partial [Helicobacter sp.]|nr:hypothetical protein [Helicobacter sp.]